MTAGAADDEEPHGADDLAPTVPGANFGEGIGTDQEVELVARGERGADFFDGVDGVAACGVLLEARDFEGGVGAAGELSHVDPVLVRGVGDAPLVRRVRGGDEQNTIEVESSRGLAGDGKVRLVDGVECAAEKREPHTRSIFTEWTLTSLTGRSWAPRGTREIFSTTS